jgi:predicted DCC family thiol-disulfide oxidoreductase YuxK
VPGSGKHLVLYDGDCGLCSRLVRFVVRHDPEGRFAFASLQGEAGRAALARLGRHDPGLDTALVVADRHTGPRLLDRSRAALFVLSHLPLPWRWLGAARVLPVTVLDRLYDLVARHRHRARGRNRGCPVPTPAEKSRYLDLGP